MSERYCTACDEPLSLERPFWTFDGEEFCEYCGSRLPHPRRYAAAAVPASSEEQA